jgi:hypothetical protein
MIKRMVLSLLLCAVVVAGAMGCSLEEPLDDMWTQNIYPGANNTYDIGSPTLQYRDGYFVNLNILNTIMENVTVPDGGCIYIWDSDNSDYFSLCHDGGVGIIENPTGSIYIRGDDNVVADLTGDSAGMYEFQVENSGNHEVASIDTAGNVEVIGNISGQNLNISGTAVIGNVPTAALLTLASGNITAGLAPLKFTAGPLLTVPVPGAMEFDGTGIYLTNTDHRRFISLASDSIITTVNATTIAPTTLWNGTINANEMKVNRVYEVKGCGIYSTHDANDQVTVNMTVDSTVIMTLTTPKGTVTNKSWSFDVYFTVRKTGVNGILSTHGEIESGTGEQFNTMEEVAVDTTAVNYVTLKATWSDTSNEVKLTQAWLAVSD